MNTDYISIGEVQSLASQANGYEYHLIPGKRIMFESVRNDGKPIALCTPQSKYHKQGFFWCDITTIQADLLNQYESAILFFRLEGRLMVTIGWKELKPLLNINCMIENTREGTHWKLHIYTDHLSVSGNTTILPVAVNHHKENDK